MTLHNLKAILLAFVLAAVPLGQTVAAELLDRVVALANEDIVTANELARRTAEIRQRYQNSPEVLPSDDQLRRQVLDTLILERLQLQLADSMNLNITDSQVNEAVNQLADQRDMSLEAFIEAVQSSGQSYAELREQVRRELTINQVRQRHAGQDVRVTEGEVERYLDTLAGQSLQQVRFELLYRRYGRDERDQAEARLAELRAGASLADSEDARNLGLRTVDDLPSVFRTVVPVLALDEAVLIEQGEALHLAQLVDKTEREAVQVDQYRVRHILVRPDALLTEDQARALLADLRQRIRDGESMGELADQFTDDLDSKGSGGELGWAQAEEFSPAVAQRVRDLPSGELSEVFESSRGFHILRVEDSRTQDVSLDVMRRQVRETLGQRKYEEALQRWLVELRAQSFVEVRL